MQVSYFEISQLSTSSQISRLYRDEAEYYRTTGLHPSEVETYGPRPTISQKMSRHQQEERKTLAQMPLLSRLTNGDRIELRTAQRTQPRVSSSQNTLIY